MIPGIQEIKALALKYSKKQLANMAQTGLIDPQKAVMAGMMRDRIAKEDMQPPTTTVAQDTLGMAPPQMGQMPPAPQGPQMPPQMGMQPPPQMAQPQPQTPAPQMGAPVQQPPVMAASGGVTSLPVDIADYAGGGIVAFGDGGDVPGFADGSVIDESVYIDPMGAPYGQPPYYGVPREGEIRTMIPRSGPVFNLREQVRVGGEPGLMGQLFGYEVSPRLPSATTTTGSNYVQVPPPAPAPAPKDKREAKRERGSAPPPPSPAAPNLGKSVILDAPTLPTSGAFLTPPTIPAPPTLRPFNPNEVKIKGAELKMPTIQEMKDITKEREAAEAAAGYNKNLTEEQLKRVEGKKGELADLKSRAGGEALMQFGLGLIGARKGEEGQRASESGRAALASYKGDMKELRDARDKLDERAEALRVADNQAKKTNSAADIAKRDAQVAKYDAAQLEVFKAENSLAEKNAMISATVHGTQAQQEMEGYKTGVTAGQQQYATQQLAMSKHQSDMIQAATALQQIKQQAVTAERGHEIDVYRAKLAYSASMYNSSVIKQAGLDERRSRTLIEASDSYIRNNKDNQAYLNNPMMLQQDAMAYANRLAGEFMSNTPAGQRATNKSSAPTTGRPPLNQFQR